MHQKQHSCQEVGCLASGTLDEVIRAVGRDTPGTSACVGSWKSGLPIWAVGGGPGGRIDPLIWGGKRYPAGFTILKAGVTI